MTRTPRLAETLRVTNATRTAVREIQRWVEDETLPTGDVITHLGDLFSGGQRVHDLGDGRFDVGGETFYRVG